MKNKSLTPQIRFKGYEDEWQQAKVREVFTLGNGYTPSKANPAFWTNGTIPWFRMEDIRENGRVLSDSIQHVTPEAVKSSGLFPAGSLIVSTTATIGEHALLIADSLANQRFTVFQTVNRWSWLSAKYLLYRFYGLGDWCRKNVNAGGLAAVSIADLQKYDIDFPSSDKERDSIADYFGNIEQLIAEAEREVSRLEKMKQASLQKLFPRPGATAPEIRFDGYTEPWVERKISDCASFSRGQGYTKKDLRESGTPIFLYGRLYTKYSTYVDSVDTYSFVAPYSVISKGNEVVMPSSGETAEDIAVASAILTKGIILSGGLNVIIPNNDINPIFLALSLTFSHAHYELAKKAQGKSVVHIYNQDIADLIISCPPTLDEQKAIGEYFRNLDSLLSAKRQKLVKLRNIKQACLDKMFVNTSDL